jgi:hypothetical protein
MRRQAKLFSTYCARCGVGLITWAATLNGPPSSAFVWKHQTGGNGPRSCGRKPLPVSRLLHNAMESASMFAATHPEAPAAMCGPRRSQVVAFLEARHARGITYELGRGDLPYLIEHPESRAIEHDRGSNSGDARP